MMTDDLPELRSEKEIIAAFFDLADECEHRTNPEEVADRFDTAFRLILEARVPRMPDTVEELRDKLEAAMTEPLEASPVEDVMERLEKHRKDFEEYRKRFDTLLELEAWDSAAEMLFPVSGRSGPGYLGGIGGETMRYVLTNKGYDEGKYQHGAGCTIYHYLSSGGGPKVKAFAPFPGLAMLAAIMRAHAEWHDLWKR